MPASICRAGWFADYPTYDNFMFDLFHTDSIGGNNHGPFSNEEFDALVDEAKQTVDADEQADAVPARPSRSCSTRTPAWCRSTGTAATTSTATTVANFPQTNFGLILWEQVALE